MQRAFSKRLGRRLRFAGALTGAALFAGGCAGTLDDPSALAPINDGGAPGSLDATSSCADVPSTLFMNTCGTAACHSAALKTEGLDLVSPGVASRLVDVPSMEEPGQSLINPAAPDQSYLLEKLQPNPPSGLQMPYGSSPLSAAEIACVRGWIIEQITDGGAQVAATDGGQE